MGLGLIYLNQKWRQTMMLWHLSGVITIPTTTRNKSHKYQTRHVVNVSRMTSRPVTPKWRQDINWKHLLSDLTYLNCCTYRCPSHSSSIVNPSSITPSLSNSTIPHTLHSKYSHFIIYQFMGIQRTPRRRSPSHNRESPISAPIIRKARPKWGIDRVF